jgi:hypothetical protein
VSASPCCATQPGRSSGSAGGVTVSSGSGGTGSAGRGAGSSGAVSVGTVSVGTVRIGIGSATGAVDELVTAGEVDSLARGAAGCGDGLSTVDWAGDAVNPTSTPRECVRTRERCRPGSGEACGSFLTEPGTMSACCGTSTTDACGPRSTSRAEGEADPMPNTTIAPYRTADPAVAERPSLNWPLGLCLASPIPPLSG